MCSSAWPASGAGAVCVGGSRLGTHAASAACSTHACSVLAVCVLKRGLRKVRAPRVAAWECLPSRRDSVAGSRQLAAPACWPAPAAAWRRAAPLSWGASSGPFKPHSSAAATLVVSSLLSHPGCSAVAGLLNHLFVYDPTFERTKQQRQQPGGASGLSDGSGDALAGGGGERLGATLKRLWGEVAGVVRIPTFGIIIVQVGWQAMGGQQGRRCCCRTGVLR